MPSIDPEDSRFPVLCLSSLPLECVATQLMCRDIFQFSTVSKDCFDAMKDAVRINPNNRRLSINLSGDKYQLTLNADGFASGDGEGEAIEWQFNGTWNRRRRWNVELYSGPQPKTLMFREKTKGRYVTASNSVEELLQLAEHIANLFRAHTKRITISAENCRFLPAIQLVPVFQQTREVVIGVGGVVSHDTMLQVLTGFQSNCKSLWIQCNVEPNSNPQLQLQFNGPILTEEIYISDGSWFTAQLFHTFNGNRLILRDCILTNSDLNKFLRNWKASDRRWTPNLQLNRLWNRGIGFGHDHVIDPELQRRWNQERWDVGKIIKGLRDIRHVPAHPLAESNFHVFKRQTDGMKLSLHITSENFAAMISMMFRYDSN